MVIAVTGIRSEYDILYPVLDELRSNGLDVKIVVSGAHLSDYFGNTIDKIIDNIDMNRLKNNPVRISKYALKEVFIAMTTNKE